MHQQSLEKTDYFFLNLVDRIRNLSLVHGQHTRKILYHKKYYSVIILSTDVDVFKISNGDAPLILDLLVE